MKTLIVGCGSHVEFKEKDHVYLDIRPYKNVDVVHNCDDYPWPFEDNSFLNISAIHVVEHLHKLLTPFMDECWRILMPGGALYIETPCAGMDPDLEWADPTHVRCYRPHSFTNYFLRAEMHKLNYTARPWSLLHLEVPESGPKKNCLIVHCSVIK